MTETPTIQAALVAVMNDVGAVAKRDRNTQSNYSFRGIDAVINAVSPAFRRHGVVALPKVLDHAFGTIEVGQKRTPMSHVTMTVEYTFHGPAGDTLTTTVMGEAFDSGDKAVPKAMSVAFRTALLQALALPTDDPEPDAETYERTSRGPLAEAKAQLWTAWQATGGNADTLKEAFATWSGGVPLTYAEEPMLREFTNHVGQMAAAKEGQEQ